MIISFKTRKLEKVFNSGSTLKKTYSDKVAQAIMIRLAVLKNARTLANCTRQSARATAPTNGQTQGGSTQ